MSSGCQDARYYFYDGNITIMVSETLFKVHKSILGRDGSTFENMFSLNMVETNLQTVTTTIPGSETFQQDGSGDENPIQIQGDTVDEFRDLLWSLYALPQEIVETTCSLTDSDMVRLSNVARMAHKYHFLSTETWALNALISRFQKESSPVLETDLLIKLTEAAVLCEHSSLLDVIRMKWKAFIMDLSHPDLAIAMEVTERLSLRDLCGLAYYTMSRRGRHYWDNQASLTRDQRIRLLSGHYNLSQFCASLPDDPPPIIHHAKCDDPDICSEHWAFLWEAMLTWGLPKYPGIPLKSQPPIDSQLDLLERLERAVGIIAALNNDTFPESNKYEFDDYDHCWEAALAATRALQKRMQGDLMNFFQDVV